MPLYEVTRTYYVWAEDRLDAESIMPKDPLSCDTEIFEIRKGLPILANWVDAIPFGYRNDDKTCRQLRDEGEAE